MQHLYGIVTSEGYQDCSRSEKGAKNYATRNGFDEIYIRFNCGYGTKIIAFNKKGKWIKVK